MTEQGTPGGRRFVVPGGAMRLFKYLPADFAEPFIDSGMVRIGTLHDFRKTEAYGTEIGDLGEGTLSHRTIVNVGALHAENLPEHASRIATFGAGSKSVFIRNCEHVQRDEAQDGFVYCMTKEELSRDEMRRMGKDVGFAITNPRGFISLLTAALNREHPLYDGNAILGECVYRSRVSEGIDPPDRFHPAFVKDPQHASQKEARLLWRPGREPIAPLTVRCGPLHLFCRRLT